ncbi:hypothetical protein BH18CHL2_BH18CHL2_08410 [soil metagenome]
MRRGLTFRRTLLATAVLTAVLAVPQPAIAAHGWHAAFAGQDAWPTIRPGAETLYTMRFRNSGTEPWQRGVPGRQVNLAVLGDSEQFAQQGLAVGWLAPARPATTTEAIVPAGGIATFTFRLRGPASGTSYRVFVHPVREGVEHLEDEGAFVLVVGSYGFHSRWLAQSAYPTVDPGAETQPITVSFQNAGTRAWRKGAAGEQANLGINGDDRSLSAYGMGWPTPDRVAVQSEAAVEPGQTASFTFRMRGPAAPGTYRLHLRPVIDGVTWMEDEGVFVELTVRGSPAGVPVLHAAVVQDGLRVPWDVAFAPDGRMFATERVGNILVYASGAAGASQLSNTAVANVRAEGEAGAMSIELDPGFAQNGYVYVCASVMDGGQWLNQVIRYRMTGNTPVPDIHVIRFGMRAGTNHDGCRIRFGPDGRLWVTMGDSADTRLPQDPAALNGKVLRVNTDGTIPADNPVMPGAARRTAVYTMGNRNPQGLAFEPGTGRAFGVEHGDTTEDEINILAPGANYGYPLVRGSDGPGGYADPAWSSGGSTTATSGADFAHGPAWGAWSGSLFVANLKEADVRRFSISGATATQREGPYDGVYGHIRMVRRGPGGSLYLTTSNGTGDRIIRITPG